MSSSIYIKNVALVGAAGNSGSFMAKSLLGTGRHTVTAITRADSSSKLPDGVKVAKVDYDDDQSLVDALRGHDALVITLSVFAPKDTEDKLIKAAADANVPWVLPNEWSPDSAHEGLVKDVFAFHAMPAAREKIKQLGKSSYIAVSCGFWYEWSLAIPMAFGIDPAKKEAVLFDDGETITNTSTWPQVGRAVAALLSLPIHPQDGNIKRSLEHFKNGHVYISSFSLTQKDMIESACRVTGSNMADWKISTVPSKERYEEGTKAMQEGDRMGFVRHMYTRVFFPDDSGNFEKRVGTANELLGLPVEDLDEATGRAVERQKNSPW